MVTLDPEQASCQVSEMVNVYLTVVGTKRLMKDPLYRQRYKKKNTFKGFLKKPNYYQNSSAMSLKGNVFPIGAFRTTKRHTVALFV